MKTNYREAYTVDLKEFCHFAGEHDYVEVTEWTNGEGFDVTVSSKLGTRLFLLTWGEFEAIVELTEEINNNIPI